MTWCEYRAKIEINDLYWGLTSIVAIVIYIIALGIAVFFNGSLKQTLQQNHDLTGLIVYGGMASIFAAVTAFFIIRRERLRRQFHGSSSLRKVFDTLN